MTTWFRFGVFVLVIAVRGATALAAPPPNDNFADAQTISGLEGAIDGELAEATAEPDEPPFGDPSCTKSLWYRWTAPTYAAMRFSGLPHLSVAVYTGSTLADLVPVPSLPNSDRFQAVPETAYVIRVAQEPVNDGYGFCADPTATLSWSSGPSNDFFAAATLIDGPSGDILGTTAGASFEELEPSYAARLQPPRSTCPRSVWYRWTAPSSGPITFSAGSFIAAVYEGGSFDSLTLRAFVADSTSSTGLGGASFEAAAGTTYSVAVVVLLIGESGLGCVDDIVGPDFHLRWEPANGPANDFFADALPIGDLQGSVAASFAGATSELGEGSSVWYRWTAPSASCMVFETAYAGICSTISIFQGSEFPTADLVSADAQGGEAGFNCQGSRLAFHAVAGNEYHIMVAGYGFPNPQTQTVLQWTYAGAGSANDNFANAETITGLTGSIAGSNAGATIECGERELRGSSTIGGYISATVWYTWISPVTARVAFTTDGSGFDSGLAIYTGNQVDELALVGSNDDSGDIPTATRIGPAKVVFDAVVGTTYRISVGGFNNLAGPLMLNWAAVPANDDFANAQEITGLSGLVTANNLGASHEAGEPGHTGDLDSRRSIWYRWVAPSSGRIVFLPFGSDRFADVFVYTGSAVDSLTAVARAAPPLGDARAMSGYIFDATQGTTYYIAVDGWSTGKVVLTWQTPADNDNFANAQVISGTSNRLDANNAGATTEPGEPNPCGLSGLNSTVWYVWTPPESGQAQFSITSSTFYPTISVYVGGALQGLSSLGCNYNTVLPVGVSFVAQEGSLYRIAVGALGAVERPPGDFNLDWTLLPFTPTLTLTPTDRPTDTPTTTPTPSQTLTPTPSKTPSPTFSHTLTATVTRTPTPSGTQTFTPPPTDTSTPTNTATHALTPTRTPTPSPPLPTSPTSTVTPTATSTPPPGDANCDGRVTAADLLAVITLIPFDDPGACGAADANGDHVVNEDDIPVMIKVIFVRNEEPALTSSSARSLYIPIPQ